MNTRRGDPMWSPQTVEKLFCDSKITKSFRPPFSKGGGAYGRRPHRSLQAAKFLPKRAQEGRKSPPDCFSVGILACWLGRYFCIVDAKVAPGDPHPSPGVPHNLTPFVHIAKRHILFLHAEPGSRKDCPILFLRQRQLPVFAQKYYYTMIKEKTAFLSFAQQFPAQDSCCLSSYSFQTESLHPDFRAEIFYHRL